MKNREIFLVETNSLKSAKEMVKDLDWIKKDSGKLVKVALKFMLFLEN